MLALGGLQPLADSAHGEGLVVVNADRGIASFRFLGVEQLRIGDELLDIVIGESPVDEPASDLGGSLGSSRKVFV